MNDHQAIVERLKKWVEDHVEVLGGATIVIVLITWVYVLVHFIQKFW